MSRPAAALRAITDRLRRQPGNRQSVHRWALRGLLPGRACILDVETTGLDGWIVEIAVIDAATGLILLDTPVHPLQPIPAEATAVHGITDADVASAPTWLQVLPQLTAAIGRRQVIAYNAAFDRGQVLAECRRWSIRRPRFARAGRWDCLMAARSTWLNTPDRIRLDGPHRALGDTDAARAVLTQIAHSPAPARGSHLQPGQHAPRSLRSAPTVPTNPKGQS